MKKIILTYKMSASSDPNTTDFSKYSHILGNNEFDADMDIVETFVRSYRQPNNLWAQSSVFNYYVSRIQHYWDITKEYATSMEIELDNAKIDDRIPARSNKFSSEELEQYELQLLDYIDKITYDFKTNKVLDVIAISKAFAFIGQILCLMKPSFEIRSYNNYYILPNRVGLFGLNTYLYAYFENIFLIGMPQKGAMFDQNFDCPYFFMYHDIEHSDIIIMEGSNKFAKFVYYNILNDPTLNNLQKQCHIANLWVSIHEKSFNISFMARESKTLDAISETFNPAVMLDFFELYKSFSDFILTEDNINMLSQLDTSYQPGITKTREFQDFLAGKTIRKSSELKIYFYLAFLYTQRYINKLKVLFE